MTTSTDTFANFCLDKELGQAETYEFLAFIHAHGHKMESVTYEILDALWDQWVEKNDLR